MYVTGLNHQNRVVHISCFRLPEPPWLVASLPDTPGLEYANIFAKMGTKAGAGCTVGALVIRIGFGGMLF